MTSEDPIPGKPSWMSNEEWKAELQRANQQLQYDMHYAPEYVKNSASIGAVLIMAGIVVAIVCGLIGLALKALGVG